MILRPGAPRESLRHRCDSANRCAIASPARSIGGGAAAFVLMWMLAGGTSLPGQDRMFQVDEQQLVSYAFNNLQSRKAAVAHAEGLLAGEIDFIAQIGTLTPQQQRRLALAARGAIARFFEAADRVIADVPRGNVTEDEWQNIWRRLGPVRSRHERGLNGRGSLFAKTVRMVLDAEQLEAHAALVAERTRRHYRAVVLAAIMKIDNHVPLTAEQRAKFLQVVLEKTTPVERYPNSYSQFGIIYGKIADMPEADLKPLFSQAEWKAIRQLVQSGAVRVQEHGNNADADIDFF
mgnify:CR=1 FL=1